MADKKHQIGIEIGVKVGGEEEVDDLAKGLKGAGKAARDLGEDAGASAAGVDEVGKAADRSGGLLDKLGGMAKAVGVAIAGYFGIKAFAGGIQSAAEFEAAMSRVKAFAGATTEEMQALTAAAQEAGMSTRYNSVEAANALENLAKAGLSANDAIETLPAALALATAGDIELATSAEYLTKAIQGMGLEFADAARVADVLAMGANATNTSVDGLAQALSYAAPVANSLGVSLESTVAIIGKFADAGIDASRAGTALNSILSQFSNPASKFRQELGAAGIVTNDFEQALRELAAKGADGQRAINAVGLEAGPALRALLGQGMGALDELTQQLRNAEGSAQEAAATMSDNLTGAMVSLRSVWDAVVQALNTPVLDVVRQGVEQLTGALRGALTGGVVEKFGLLLADAFERGRKGITDFVATLDVQAIIDRFGAIAARVGEAFGQITTFATNAGYAVQTAWGVMSAGANAVMMVIHSVAAGFAAMASGIQHGIAWILEAIAKISFGSVAESFKRMAAEVRASAEATGAVVEAFGERAHAALDDMADSAQMARDGWAGMTGQAREAGPVLERAGQNAQRAADGLEDLAEAGEQAADQLKKSAKAQEESAQASAEVAQEVARLRQEYAQLIASGDLQGAAQRMQEIDKIQGRVAQSAQQAAQSAALIDQAYADLGMKSRGELQRLADTARAAFERVKGDAKSTPPVVSAAWREMAQAQIEAAGGVAPAWLKAQAAQYGFVIETNELGEAVVQVKKKLDDAVASAEKLGKAGKQGAGEVKVGLQETVQAAGQAEQAVVQYATRLTGTFLSAHAQMSKWRDEAAAYSHALEGQMQSMQGRIRGPIEQYRQLFAAHRMLLTKYADDYVHEMERIDAAVERLNRRQSETGKGIDDLRMRLLQLNGTQEQVARESQRREREEIERKQQLARLELERATLRKDAAAQAVLRQEIEDYKEQLSLLGQIHAAEEKKRKQQARDEAAKTKERNAGGSGSSSTRTSSAGGDSSGSGSATVLHRLEIGGRRFDVPTTQAGGAQLQEFLQELKAAARSSV